MKKKILSCLYCLICFLLNGQNEHSIFDRTTQSKIEQICDLIIGTEYEQSLSLAETIKNDSLKYDFTLLLNTLINDGGDTSSLSDSIQLSNFGKIIHHLNHGYSLLSRESQNPEVFKHFSSALKLSRLEKSNYLEKVSLLGITDFYFKSLLKSNNEAFFFIQEFKKKATTRFDFLRLHINEVIFDLRSITFEVSISQSLVSDVQNEMNFIKQDANIRALYGTHIGNYYEATNDYKKAKELYQKTLNISKPKTYLRNISYRTLIRLSEISRKEGNYKQALIFLSEAKEFINPYDKRRSQYYLSLYSSKNYFKLNNYKEAYSELQLSNDLGDQLKFFDNKLKISDLHTKYQTAEKEKQIIEEQAKSTKNKNIAYTLGTSLLLLSVIALLTYRNTKRKQRIAEQEKELQIQKTTTVLKEQEINTINAMVEGQEKERLRLARDLHDNLGGTLAAVKMHIGNLQNNLGKSANPEELLEKANTLISEAYTSVRSIAHERNSGVMAKEGLLPAIQKLARKVSSTGGIHIEVQDFGLNERLSNHLEITIFRIVQELVTNIIKHADATEAQISLTQHDEELNIVVEDNGKGFKVGKLHERDGMGLGSIERRVEHLEGTMLVDSTPGKGTNIIIDLPI